MDYAILVSASACIIELLCAAWVTFAAHKYVDLIGGDFGLKRDVLSRHMFNFYGVLVLSFVFLARALGWFSNDLFIGLFVLIVGGLGFKLTAELFGK